jgi:hypothetical protein
VTTGWLLCERSVVSRLTYTNLFAAISTTLRQWKWDHTTFGLLDLN